MSELKRVDGQDGLYVHTVEMPCGPHDFWIMRWALPSTFNKAEPEEAAARILSFSMERGEWVGVSWLRIGAQISAEFEKRRAYEEARAAAHDAERDFRQEMRRWWWLSVLTLGIYAIYGSKPTKEEVALPDSDFPLTTAVLDGGQGVANGIHTLVDRGYLTRVTTNEGYEEKAEDVFFPTPEMMKIILTKQGRVS